MKILAIETSCDETAMAVVEAAGKLDNPRFKVLKNIVSSQIDVHRPYGGVFPTLAKREHIKNLPMVLEQILGKGQNAKGKMDEIDVVAVTVGPGLEPALWTGINFAKETAKKYKKPLLGANHLEGHLYSFLLSQKTENSKGKKQKSPHYAKASRGKKNSAFPAVALIVSGGHTVLLVLKKIDEWKKIGETRDDAVGEAYDKVARMLGMPYPGGPEIERAAKNGNPEAVEFPRPMIHHKNYDFSFSGLKTAVYYYLRDPKLQIHPNDTKSKKVVRGIRVNSGLSDRVKADIAASFQAAVIEVLVTKTMRAVEEYGTKSILLGGGVAANSVLRKTLRTEVKKRGAELFVSEMKYSGDNAAMIGVAAYINDLSRKSSRGGPTSGRKYRITAQANLNL